MIRAVGALFLVMQIASAEADEGLAAARAAFARDIASAYDVAERLVVVQPRYPGLPDNPFDALETPPFHAVRADWPGMDPGPRGYAAVDGRTVSVRNPAAIADLLEAAGVNLSPPSDTAIVRRLMWLYQAEPAGRLIDDHPTIGQVQPPSVVRASDGTIRASWFVERGGRTGWVGVFHASFSLPPGGRPLFTETLLQ